MNLVYRAYRFPYDWIPQIDPPQEVEIPQVDPPQEVEIPPLDVTSFGVPGARGKGAKSDSAVEGTLPYQPASTLCVISDKGEE